MTASDAEQWRILVGEEPELLDEFVRTAPEDAYEIPFADRMRDRNVMAFLP